MATSSEATPLPENDLLYRLALALALGLLVGLQRQRAESHLAGIRTFPLITLLGAMCCALAQPFGVAVLAAGLVAVAALAVLGNLLKAHRDGQADPGLTTEAAMLLMFVVGAYAMVGDAIVCLVVAGGVAVLLQLKEPLHRAIASLGDHDFWAITQFVLISLVILPIVPDRRIGPYDVINPREVWWMVVLIVGIGLAGYLVYRYFGAKAGTLLGGILGGLVSSTATAVSWAQRSRDQPLLVPVAAVFVVVSSSVVFVRVLIEIAVVAPNVLGSAGPPIGILLLTMVIVSWLERRRSESEEGEQRPALSNPSELKSAFVFAGIYAGVVLAIAFAKDQFGQGGLYLVALLSGLTDMDAITLSTAQLMKDGRVEIATGWRLIVTASLSNLGFKLATLAFAGPLPLLRRVAARFLTAIAVGLLLLLLWPL